MTTIINMTQHNASPDQRGAGVVDFGANAHIMKGLLTFVRLPTSSQVLARAVALVDLLQANHDIYDVDSVMIGGAPYLMAPLVSQLTAAGYKPVFAYTDRVSVDVVQADGSIKKTAMFKHLGFVDA